jgi:hypothetical protein
MPSSKMANGFVGSLSSSAAKVSGESASQRQARRPPVRRRCSAQPRAAPATTAGITIQPSVPVQVFDASSPATCVMNPLSPHPHARPPSPPSSGRLHRPSRASGRRIGTAHPTTSTRKKAEKVVAAQAPSGVVGSSSGRIGGPRYAAGTSATPRRNAGTRHHSPPRPMTEAAASIASSTIPTDAPPWPVVVSSVIAPGSESTTAGKSSGANLNQRTRRPVRRRCSARPRSAPMPVPGSNNPTKVPSQVTSDSGPARR